MHTIEDVYSVINTATFAQSEESDMKRSNANINTDTAMGAMLTYGAETAKMWVDDTVLPSYIKEWVDENVIYIHDKDFYGLTETCCQIELDKLFQGGFNTGHGYIREPQSITSAAALTCIALQSNQNEMHGGQAIPAIDWYLAPYVAKTYEKHLVEYTWLVNSVVDDKVELTSVPTLAWIKTREDTFQAMEALIHNLNTMHSRAGAQVPFSSINYGTCTSKEGQLIIEALLEATKKGLGHGETPIFPVQIFKVKEGVNYNEGEPNYWLFKKAMEVSAERLFPNFSFLDAPFNAQYYKDGDFNTEIAYMGCRTRVMGNVNGEEVTGGRGNLSFTSINLVRLALEAKSEAEMYDMDEEMMLDTFEMNIRDAMRVCTAQLLHRYEIQVARHVYNYPFLMGNGVWKDSEKLDYDDTLEEVLKHGSLSIGFIGLAEAMVALYGVHHGEDKDVWDIAKNIVEMMHQYCDFASKKHNLNFALIATPAEGLSGRFVPKDVRDFGVIEGVTDKPYYTNSFHLPVYYDCTAAEKIRKEAPFHALCNGGHITYVEVDGDVSNNIEAFEAIIRMMHDAGIGYGSVNHPVDRDPVCGYRGIIGDVCPCCGRREFEDVPDENKYMID